MLPNTFLICFLCVTLGVSLALLYVVALLALRDRRDAKARPTPHGQDGPLVSAVWRQRLSRWRELQRARRD